MKEFNLTEYLKNPSQKVVTRDGREVRIICTDMKSEYPLIALITDKKDNSESPFVFTKNGRYFFEETNNDLFFAPIKREGWVNLFKDKEINYPYIPGIIHDSEEEAKEAIKGDPDFIATIKIEWEE